MINGRSRDWSYRRVKTLISVKTDTGEKLSNEVNDVQQGTSLANMSF